MINRFNSSLIMLTILGVGVCKIASAQNTGSDAAAAAGYLSQELDKQLGAGVNTGLAFKGVESIWDPQFDELDAMANRTVEWGKRCYFLNTRFMKLRDDDLDIVAPIRPHDTLAMYAMVNLRCALSISRANAHAVLAI